MKSDAIIKGYLPDEEADEILVEESPELTREQENMVIREVIKNKAAVCPICGGLVVIHSSTLGADIGWEIVCGSCDYLYCED